MPDAPAMPTEKVTGDVTILEVGEGRREWSSAPKDGRPAGKFIGYRVKMRLASGVEVGNVEINTKADSPKFVTPGETAFGVFDPRPGNQYGPRFQKKSPQGGGGGGRGRSPEEQARIQRQHSQEMAIRVAVSAGWFNGIDPAIGDAEADDAEEPETHVQPDPNVRAARQMMASLLNGPVKRLIDYFDQDIDRGAKAAMERRQSGGS